MNELLNLNLNVSIGAQRDMTIILLGVSFFLLLQKTSTSLNDGCQP